MKESVFQQGMSYGLYWGKKKERDRIVDMLEKRKCSCSTMVCIPFCRHGLTLDEIIALIKEG